MPFLSAALAIGLVLNLASASYDGSAATLRVSTNANGAQANDASYGASLSATGRYVAFSSEASNLVSSDVNDLADVFVKDMTTNAVVRISVGVGGTDTDGESTSPSISGDGQGVATFRAAGASEAYCGDPAAASAEEGRALLEVLADEVVQLARASWPELFGS